jgi:hypothetical protein
MSQLREAVWKIATELAARGHITDKGRPHVAAGHTSFNSIGVVVRLGHYKGEATGTVAFRNALTLLMQAVPRRN